VTDHGTDLSPPRRKPAADTSSPEARSKSVDVLFFDDGCNITPYLPDRVTRWSILNITLRLASEGPLRDNIRSYFIEWAIRLVLWLFIMYRVPLRRKEDSQ
jgi:hypothetical protein